MNSRYHCLILTCSFGVDNSFWDALSIKVGHFVHVYDILHQHWSSWTYRLHSVLVVDGNTMTGGQLLPLL